MMQTVDNNGVAIAVHSSGPKDAPALLTAHALGFDHRIFDAALPHLPMGMRIVRYDARGHGASDTPPGPYTLRQMVSDARAVCTALDLTDVAVAGVSMGGLTALGLALRHPELVRALVLSNTAARIGTGAHWDRRIAEVQSQGLDAIAQPSLDRWFAPGFADRELWGNRLRAARPDAYVASCAAIAGADLREEARILQVPTLCIACSHDKSTPPDLVRETADTIPEARFVLLRRAGHLPCIDHPEAFGAAITGFLAEIEDAPPQPPPLPPRLK